MTRTDREGEICAAKIKITDTPYISALNRVDGLDNRGEYQYFDARGLNLREDIYPDIYKNGVRVAEFVEAFGAPGRPEHLPDTHMIYRYRKLFRDEAWTTNAAFSVDGGGRSFLKHTGAGLPKVKPAFIRLIRRS